MKKNIILASLLLCMGSCSLDYTNNETISPDNVWTDKAMINAFLNDIYGRKMPGWPINANGTDEGMNGPRDMSDFDRGIYSVESNGVKLDYDHIDRINFFLDNLEGVTVLSDDQKEIMKAQALFWRAWDYWGKVRNMGGVPLILHIQDITDMPSLFVERSSTSDCMAQILTDIDYAISTLPDKWEGENYGRIDKGTAMAFKGRVLMHYASPLFNPNNDQGRWQAAYQANKEAVEFLQSVGKGLYQGNFEDIWYDEQNMEVVMVNQYYYPDHALDQKNIRPQPLTKDYADFNQAILPLIMAFPKKDGTKLELDIDKLSDPAYNDQFITDFYTNRDPRFYASVFSPGTVYPTTEPVVSGMSYWNTWKAIPNPSGEGLVYQSMVFEQIDRPVGSGYSGFFQKKGLDKSISIATVYQAETDWIEIRFAEVLMNYGECANEVGNTGEALQVLYDIRKRAGITNSTGNYGITATSQSDVRQAYIDERLIEFAYEGKRRGDLRRWKRYDILNDMKYRGVLYPVIKDNANVSTMDWTKDMYDPEVRKLFKIVYIKNVDGDENYQFNLPLDKWFSPISRESLDKNSKLIQNKEWGGTFDPLL